MSRGCNTLAIALQLAAPWSVPGGTNAPPPLTIDGAPVTAAEFHWFMEWKRPEIFDLARRELNLEHRAGFWTNRTRGGETLAAVLRNTTREFVTQERLAQLVYRDLRLLAEVGHEAFLRELDTVNATRQQARAAGKVIYGPVTFDARAYYQHRTASLRVRAIELLATNSPPPDDAPWRARVEEWRRGNPPASLSSWELLTVRTVPAVTRDTNALTATARKLMARLESGQTYAELLNEWPATNDFELTRESWRELTDERLAETLASADEFAIARSLPVGRAALLSANDGMARILRCQGRGAAPETSFARFREQGRRAEAEARLARLLADKRARTTVVINDSAIAAIPAESP